MSLSTKQLPWIIAGTAVGLAAYFILNQPRPSYSTGYDGVEDAAQRTARWGTKQRIAGSGTNALGKLKEGFGRATGNPDLADEGIGDQAAGATKDAVGKVASAVGQTLHDLNV
jgi:uncharacterized protein YjbJ (UPF0337 family)